MSPLTIAKMQHWIKDSLNSSLYFSIENDSFVPMCLLNVNDGLFLQHTRVDNAKVVPYLALTHYWGHQTAKRPMYKTTLLRSRRNRLGYLCQRTWAPSFL